MIERGLSLMRASYGWSSHIAWFLRLRIAQARLQHGADDSAFVLNQI